MQKANQTSCQRLIIWHEHHLSEQERAHRFGRGLCQKPEDLYDTCRVIGDFNCQKLADCYAEDCELTKCSVDRNLTSHERRTSLWRQRTDAYIKYRRCYLSTGSKDIQLCAPLLAAYESAKAKMNQ